jgi:hypothetical protein
MITNISVEIMIPNKAYEVLKLLSEQNKEVVLLLNSDGSIILGAQVLDNNGLDD